MHPNRTPPPLLARIRWTNLARLAILSAAVLLIASGPDSCQDDPPTPPFTPPPAFPAAPEEPTATVPEPDLGAAKPVRRKAGPAPAAEQARSKAKRRIAARPRPASEETGRRRPPSSAAPPPVPPPPVPVPAFAAPSNPAPPSPQPGEFTPDP